MLDNPSTDTCNNLFLQVYFMHSLKIKRKFLPLLCSPFCHVLFPRFINVFLSTDRYKACMRMLQL